MCGICGLVGVADPRQYIEEMTAALRHRGPDNMAVWSEASTALGHCRLSIVDLSKEGNQPMSNETGGIWMVANGEIYNSDECRLEMERKGHVFRSHSDNEVLIHLYEEYGEAFAERINGMIALALWDTRNNRLLLLRDRIGIKPLYYHITQRGLAFASEIKSLLTCPLVAKGIDPQGLAQYFRYENTFGRQTLYKGIHLLRPGELLSWQRGTAAVRNYFTLALDSKSEMSFDEAVEQYREEARGAVDRHLMSDVPVASYLSGGIDSSTVATLAAGRTKGALLTFCGYFNEGGWYDESGPARAVAQHVGAQHTRVDIASHHLSEVMDDVVFSLDEPRMSVGAFSQFIVAREASQHAKVILTGHGGDELYAGYPVFKLAGLLSGEIWKESLRLGAFSQASRSELPHLVYFLMQWFSDRQGSGFLPTVFPQSILRKGLNQECRDEILRQNPGRDLLDAVGRYPTVADQIAAIYLKAYLPGLFVVEDKISMAHSLESRTPLCDNRLIDLSMKIPLSVKLFGGQLKAIPRRAMRDLLPQTIYQQPKRGFPTPLAKWLRIDLREWLCDRLCGDCILTTIFTKQFIRQTVDDYFVSWKRRVRPLDEIQTNRIWALLSLEAWLRVTQERLNITLEF